LTGRGARSVSAKAALLPLALLWLAVHAVLLAIILGAKFLFTKTAIVVLLLMAATVFLFAKLRAIPRKLVHSPVV
jgi:hypothetical protein